MAGFCRDGHILFYKTNPLLKEYNGTFIRKDVVLCRYMCTCAYVDLPHQTICHQCSVCTQSQNNEQPHCNHNQ